MTDVAKLLDGTVGERKGERENGGLNQRTAYSQQRREGIQRQIEDKGKPMSSLSTD